jgi:hypothetical protein
MLLGVGAVASVVLWWKSRKPAFAAVAIACAGLIGLLWLLSYLFPSDAKKIDMALQEMSDGVQTHDLNRIFRHISSQFQQGPPTFGSTLSKAAFRDLAQGILKSRNVTEVRVWDVQIEELSRPRRSARVVFFAKPKGNWGSEVHYLVRAEFVLEEDNQWMMKKFEVFNPYVEQRQPLHIPGT